MEMIEVNTAELVGPALDWAVAKADDLPVQYSKRLGVHLAKLIVISGDPNFLPMGARYAPSRLWSQGGPLIEKYQMELDFQHEGLVFAYPCDDDGNDNAGENGSFGPTHLIAACRSIVSAKLGDTVQVPAELTR
ncbi:phage protein NinX family protein [Azotobacter chroococcum]|uniref:Uncharacterized protein DUF2591 n=1 Tax=Azotobacter chroococcum TaxID=353 RepID=A0A4R1PLH0_9GAMM|nr:phage protein NinX family protein [Azotobacter chroococcum]TBV90492.1 DUF2591 domain-containing protein [Azotobacter chroococcum]TCL32016.1 uncharacterized protein DUF2591 [Azotobacter chroococcum]